MKQCWLSLILTLSAVTACGDNLTLPPDRDPASDPDPPVLSCIPNLDGKIERKELEVAAGVPVRYVISPSGETRAAGWITVANRPATERGEGPGVAGVLLLREPHVDGRACEVRELAARDGGAHGTDQGVHGRELCATTGSRFNIGDLRQPDRL